MSKYTKDLLVIIPVHEFNDGIKTLLGKAINSVPENIDIIISTVDGVLTKVNEFIKDINNNNSRQINTVSSVKKNAKSDFCTLVNQGVNDDYKWFSILEFDDEYSSIWFDNVKKNIEYNPDVSVFLPLTDLIKFDDNKFTGYGNEAPWASSFSSELGYIDNECLQHFFDFYLTGGVFNTQDFLNVGGLKSSIKLTFWYEFLLRITNDGKKVYVIPKIGYKHMVNRPESLYNIYMNTIDEEEGKWWYELAKKEYLYKKDRNKVYEKITPETEGK